MYRKILSLDPDGRKKKKKQKKIMNYSNKEINNKNTYKSKNNKKKPHVYFRCYMLFFGPVDVEAPCSVYGIKWGTLSFIRRNPTPLPNKGAVSLQPLVTQIHSSLSQYQLTFRIKLNLSNSAWLPINDLPRISSYRGQLWPIKCPTHPPSRVTELVGAVA